MEVEYPPEVVVLPAPDDLDGADAAGLPNVDFDAESLHPLLRRWRHIARTQRKLHSRAYHQFHQQNTLFMVAIILLAGVSGFGGVLIGALQGNSCPDSFYYTVATGLLSVISASLGAVYNALSLSRKEIEHEVYCGKFQELVQEINTEAALHELNSTPVSQQGGFHPPHEPESFTASARTRRRSPRAWRSGGGPPT